MFGYIYKYTDLINNKVYIGKREKENFEENYWGSGKKWKEVLLEIGKENILREIIDTGESRVELNNKEVYWISFYNSTNPQYGYNIHKGGIGGNSLNDTKAWSDLHKGEKNGRYGKPVSQETRDKISRANKGKVRTDEFKLKVSLAFKGKKKPKGFGEKISKTMKGRISNNRKKVKCVETGEIFESIAKAGELKKICSQNISRACIHPVYTAGGYHWIYIN